MQHGRAAASRAVWAVLGMAGLAACGGSDLTIGATPTPTLTRTATAVATATATPVPTHTPALAQVAGIIVVGRDVGTGTSDGLSPLPPQPLPPIGAGFDRGLGNAEWRIDDGAVQGTTSGDGHFSISGLAPGRHQLHVVKTVDGNLLEFVAPIVVGDDGAAEVVVEVSWGLVRATSEYTQDGAATRAVFAPNGGSLIARGAQVLELGDGLRTYVDGDGDGHFDPIGVCGDLYACGDDGGCGTPDRICLCVSSCPACDDCPARACVPRGYLMSPECGPDGLCKPLPYQCRAGSTCANPGDQCSCVASCPDCQDCTGSACVAPCDPGQPTDVARIDVIGPTRLVVGQDGAASAVATLSDGTTIDVTWLATWTSSDTTVASVDPWGHVNAIAVGATDVGAALGHVSGGLHLDVVERPTLRDIYLQNASCSYPPDDAQPPPGPRPLPSDAGGGVFPYPACQQVVLIGGTIRFSAIGEFDTGYYADITDEVDWQLAPADVGQVVGGVFTAEQAGEAQLTARLDGVESDPQAIRVVRERSVVALSIYPGNYAYQTIVGGPVPPGSDAAPCFECGYSLTLLRGDQVTFSATAHYDTGEWEDVTARVSWHSSDTGIADIDATGLMTAAAAGDASIEASLGQVNSAPLTVHIVNEATLTSLYAYQDGQDRVVAKGEQAMFHAVGYYDIGFNRDVTTEAVWRSSDESVGGFDSPGVFTGRAAGSVTVWAELGGQQSTPVPIEVFAASELDYCDPAHINRSVWSDDFNRVTLESDCATYAAPDVVELRFSVTETQRPGGIFDPCLDLFAYRGETLVRTIRQEGCGEPFLPAGAPDRADAALKYQLKAFWDLKDDGGEVVPAGVYAIRGRFYLYYDPVVSIDVTVAPTAAN